MMGPTWAVRIYGPVGLLIPLLIVLVALMAVGARTVIGWIF